MMYQISENTQVENLDAIILSVSGGGMAAGVSIAAKSINKDIKIILVEPVGKKLLDCLNTKERKWKGPPNFLNTFAESISYGQIGFKCFPILCDYVDDVITIKDEEMIAGMRIVAEKMKLGINHNFINIHKSSSMMRYYICSITSFCSYRSVCRSFCLCSNV